MYKHILVPVDLGNIARAKATIAKAKALRDEGGRITLLNVVEIIRNYVMAELPDEVFANREQEALGQLRELAAAEGCDCAVAVRTGKAEGEILAEARAGDVDLIVIASHNPGFQDFFIGSTAARVVRHAHCSVLVDR